MEGSDRRRHYFGYLSDSSRWDAVRLRPDDIMISTPSKCGTTWTQTIVALLVFGAPELPAPLSTLSPWVDMQVRSTDDLAVALQAQRHRRFLKTHTPLDGLPHHPSVTYLTVFRHPLDVALSDLDHARNTHEEIFRLREAAVGDKDLDRLPTTPERPADPADHLRTFIDAERPITGSGPHSLADLCHQLDVAWARRTDPHVHLLHYADLCADLDGQMRRIAAALAIPTEPLDAAGTWPALVDAATLDTMRARAADLAPDARLGIWKDDAAFFHQGGRRAWDQLLTPADLDHFAARLRELLPADAAAWLLDGADSGIVP